MPSATETYELEPLVDGATRLHWRIRAEERSDEVLRELASIGEAFGELGGMLESGLSAVLDADGATLTSSTHTTRRDLDT